MKAEERAEKVRVALDKALMRRKGLVTVERIIADAITAAEREAFEAGRSAAADYLEMNYDANLKWLLWRIRALTYDDWRRDED